MTVVAKLLNGTNLSRDIGFQAIQSAIVDPGVLKNYESECEVSTNAVAKGRAFVEVSRTTITPNETFLIPIDITAVETIDTSGTGYVIIRVDDDAVDDGTANAEDGGDIATIEVVASLPSRNYLLLATLASGTITDARSYSELSDDIQKNPVFYDEDEEASDAYVITVPGVKELVDGMRFFFKAATTCTGASSLEVIGDDGTTGAKALKRRFNQDTVDGDVADGQINLVAYDADADNFQILSQSANEPVVLDLATEAEAEEGTDDAKYMSPLKTRNAIDLFRVGEGTAGEAIDGSTTPKAVARRTVCKRTLVIHTDGSNLDGMHFDPASISNLSLGNASSSDKIAQSFDIPSDGGTWQLARAVAFFAANGAPSGNIIAEAMSDSAGDPDAVLTNGANTNTVTCASIPVAASNPEAQEFLWSAGNRPTCPAGKNHLSFRKSTGPDASNHLRIGYENADNYSSNYYSTYDSSGLTWSNAASADLILILEFEVDYGDEIVMFDADDPTRGNFVGFTTDNVADTDPITFIRPGNVVEFPAATFDDCQIQFGSTTPGEVTDSPSAVNGAVVAPLGKPESETILQTMQVMKSITYKLNKIKWSVNNQKNHTIFLPSGFAPVMCEIDFLSEDSSLSNDFALAHKKTFYTADKGGWHARNLSDANANVQASGTFTALNNYVVGTDVAVRPDVVPISHAENGVEFRFGLESQDSLNKVSITIYGY